MAFVERSNKGSGLTAAEMDENFRSAGGDHGDTYPHFDSGIRVAYRIYHNTDTNTFIQFTSDNIDFYLNSAYRFEIFANWCRSNSGSIRPGTDNASSSATNYIYTPLLSYAQNMRTLTTTSPVSLTISNFTSTGTNWMLLVIKFRGNLSVSWGNYYKFAGGVPFEGFDAGGNYHIAHIPIYSTSSTTLWCGPAMVCRSNG